MKCTLCDKESKSKSNYCENCESFIIRNGFSGLGVYTFYEKEGILYIALISSTTTFFGSDIPKFVYFASPGSFAAKEKIPYDKKFRKLGKKEIVARIIVGM